MWSWDSGAFGKETPTGSATINLRFPGQYFDSETGLHYNWHRYYDPATGRYITSDPLGLAAGLNTYGYAAQNPLSFVDRDGLSWWGDVTSWARGIAQGAVDIIVDDYREIARQAWEAYCRGSNRNLPAGARLAAFPIAMFGIGVTVVNPVPNKMSSQAVEWASKNLDDLTRKILNKEIDLNPPVPIHGNAQKTTKAGVETTHASTSQRRAEEAAWTRSDAESVHLNQTLGTITEGEVNSRKTPDVGINRTDGKVDIIEVLSPRQKANEQIEKNLKPLGEKAGNVDCIDCD